MVVVQQVDKKGRATELAQSEYAYSKGRLRVEMRMGETAAGQKRKKAADEMAGLGMDHIVMLMLPQEKGPFMIYPGLAAYCLLEERSVGDETGLEPKITRQELGKETVEGRECIKSLVTIEDGENKFQITVWEAIDLNRFPIQTEMTEDGTLIRTTFKDLKLAAPPEGLFELPKGFTRYNSVQEMMMGAMQRMLGGGE
ncbi:MAG: hypothetical protein RMM51_11975, partial [Verrucomicrobiae bacterium]|nr:hypothetical protein [Verrucomicrobiae bacterium]